MSPFFKRSRKSGRTAKDAKPQASAPSSASADVAAHTDDDPRADRAETDEPESAPSAEPVAEGSPAEPPSGVSSDSVSRRAKLSLAYAMWHTELMKVAEESSRPIDADDPAVVDLSFPHPTGASQLYSGKPTLLTSLVREETAQHEARGRLADLRSRIASLAERYGYAPVTLAIGQTSWNEPSDVPSVPDAGESDGGREAPAGAGEEAGADAPGKAASREPAGAVREAALLRSARLEFAGPDDAHITLTARCEVNPAVLRALRAHGIHAEEVSDLRALASDVTREDEALARLRELGRLYLPGFAFADAALLGSFIHPGQVLLADLETVKPYIEESDVMAAIAGDPQARRTVAAPLPAPERRDRAPEAERGAGDRDTAELAAVEAIASGRSVVVDTPPGSQAVETLASIVADAAASGKSVLYVPGRASAARALVDEMGRLGLGDLLLDFSDLEGVAYRLRTGMRLRAGETDETDVLELRSNLVRARGELAEYIASLHEVDPRWDESVFTLLERLAVLTARQNAPKSRVRLDSSALEDLEANREQVRALFEEAADLGAFVPAEDSPWKGAAIHSTSDGDAALARAKRLATELLPAVMSQSKRVAEETGLTPAETLGDWAEQIGMLDGISYSLDIFLPQIFERSAQDMVIATASKEWRELNGEEMRGSERRRLTKQAKDLMRPGATSADLHSDLKTVQRQREVWRRHCTEGGWPKLPDGMSQIRHYAAETDRELESLESVLPGARLASMPLGELLERVRALAEDETTMARLPRANELIAEFRARGYGGVLDDFTQRSVTRSDVEAELELVHASSVFEQLVGRSPILARTTPAGLSELAAEVRRLDEAHTRTLVVPVNRAVVRTMRETISAHREDTLSLDAQLERYSTGILRDVIAAHPRLVQVARPVWVIPSMIAAEFVPPMPWADLVIMDELDSARLAPTVSMLMRGRQIVAMGNVRRARTEDAGAAITEFAKTLPVCELPTLRAQYDELAAQTLREQGYEDVLEMVPSARHGRRPRLIVVNGRGVPNPQSGMIEGTQAEVDAVVDAVVDHALTRPEQSLAVVSVSTANASKIRGAVKRLAADSPQLGAFLGEGSREPFTVLDLTQAAGLRRDSVILTVGLGKTVHGRVLHTFGPLATPGGLTGLVDAVEAAREELTIVTALGPGEIGANRLSTPGPRLLERIIDRAAGREVALDPDASGRDVGPLLGDLAARVRSGGWEAAMDFGFDGGVRIPIVAGHPSLPGTWRVAVLADDDAYVSEPSLRRRDRYWIERLERRGWKVVRTFSTSLFIDPVGQAEKVIAALEAARQAESETPVQVPMLGSEDWTMSSQADRPADAAVPAAFPGAAASGDTAASSFPAAPAASGEASRTVPDGAAGSADRPGPADAAAVARGSGPARGSGQTDTSGPTNGSGPADGAGSAGAVPADGSTPPGSSSPSSTRGDRAEATASAAKASGPGRRPAAPEDGAPQPGEGQPGEGGGSPAEAGSSGSSKEPAEGPGTEPAEGPGTDSAEGPAQASGPGEDPERDGGVPRPRGPRPNVQAGLPLAAYTDGQLDDVVAWIASDGVVRGKDEFVKAIREELAIRRRGVQIDAILRNVISRSGLAVESSPDNAGKGKGLRP